MQLSFGVRRLKQLGRKEEFALLPFDQRKHDRRMARIVGSAFLSFGAVGLVGAAVCALNGLWSEAGFVLVAAVPGGLHGMRRLARSRDHSVESLSRRLSSDAREELDSPPNPRLELTREIDER